MEPHPPIEQDNESTPSPHREKEGSVLWRWVFLSGLLHIVLIGALFFFPQASSRGAISYPVYTVDLVGGEKIGGGGLDVGVKPAPASKKKPKKVKKERSPRASKKKKVKIAKKNKRRSQVALAKKQKKVRKRTEKKATKIATRTKKFTPLKESKKRVRRKERTREGLPSEVRNRLIQAALERVKQRAEKVQDNKSQPKIAGVGPGDGQGAAVSGQDGRGGGILKGVEFLIYRSRMLYKIKERWTWVGKNTELEVTVRFGIQENGEVVRLRIVKASGDPSYDESVIRAVRKASPLPPTPVVYRKDFMNVELTFRPRDLSG